MVVALQNLRLLGYHGVHAHEKEQGQEFVFDVELEVGERGATDRIEDAVDYSEVARAVKETSDARSYNLLEALAAAVADDLVARFSPVSVAVRVSKPGAHPGGLDATPVVTVSRP
jgi:7,8-dihydroneopterin aldolase/epimerase/oxygenase